MLDNALRLHHWIYTSTGGRIGHRLLGVRCLLLTTTGRHSGEARTASLVYAADGVGLVVVASAGGSDKTPDWLHNIRADPKVEVQVKKTRAPATARELGPGDPDYERLWRLVNENNGDRYDGYQAKTDRPIPLIVLDRRTKPR